MVSSKMKVIFLFAACLTLAGLAAGSVSAQEYAVEYRLGKWTSRHFHDAKKAKEFYDTLKKLGCEVTEEKHDDQTDITYRCLKWQRMTLNDHDAIHGWEKWLKTAGFQTKHYH